MGNYIHGVKRLKYTVVKYNVSLLTRHDLISKQLAI